MQTALIAVGTLVPMLLILVVVHELGHFFTARALGVKVLEFGVGFPPRAFGIYTGKTLVLIDPFTRFVNLSGLADLNLGQKVKVYSSEDAHGNLVARIIEAAKPKALAKADGNSDDIISKDGESDECPFVSVLNVKLQTHKEWCSGH